ncbi:DUF4062 domain-containing protein [Dyadobacter chenhuakuii]|uniref:DUF4062 domain-containing protein n=1 Tax=Dyadobacter chenhuakuii TaxID=2909339 RepID=A0A9X1TTU9_9BACT|nr:DUF4062 domain-containing protein [Dyadobacter chenhuakuii]MCF2498352.1 DUF4062 domain-containing protein [Dyadobacter chenhuakuii]
MSSQKKYQIFVSSTFLDLVEERDEVMKAILTHYHIPIGMEMFSADDDEQWTTIKETIDSSDYYVLIVGHRYGSVANEGISYTEKEYQYAIEQNIPAYVFVRDRHIATTPEQRDADPRNAVLLDAFIESATKNRMAGFWTNKEDLALKVMAALNKAFNRKPRLGWVRADQQINTDEVLEQMSALHKEKSDLQVEIEKLKDDTRRPDFKLTFPNNEFLLIIDDSKLPLDLFVQGNDSYNAYLIKYMRGRTLQQLIFGITNNGTIRGTNIYLDFIFPDEVYVRDIKSRQESPSAPNGGDDEDFTEWQIAWSNFEERNRYPLSKGKINDIIVERFLDGIMLTLNIESIQHTRSLTVREYLIAPLEKVEGKEVRVRIACEELPKPQIFTFPLTIRCEGPDYLNEPIPFKEI